MTKKRQQDFAKVNLRPGRTLAKRRNITHTNFKATKIVVRKQEFKKTSDITIAECLKKIKEHCQPKQRAERLHVLANSIRKHLDNLNIHLLQILAVIEKYVLHTTKNIRDGVLEVYTILLEKVDGKRLQNLIPKLTQVIDTAITSPVNEVRMSSFELLLCLVKNQPELICYNTNMMNSLLASLLELPQNRPSHHSFEDSATSSPHKFQVYILDFINKFLTEILKNKILPQDVREKQEVHWKGPDALYMPLYRGGRLQPVDIDDYSLDKFELLSIDPGILKFIDGISKAISGIYVAMMGSDKRSDDNVISRDKINDLSIVFQVLSNVVELATLLQYDGADDEIIKFLKQHICKKNRFPFEQQSTISSALNQALGHLNLSLSHLLVRYFPTGKESYADMISNYIRKLFHNNKAVGYKYNYLPVLAKILKVCFEINKPQVNEIIEVSLEFLSPMLKNHSYNPNRKLLISLFMMISLDPAYYPSFSVSPVMEKWYEWLIKELRDSPEKMDQKMLRNVQKIAHRKYELFLKCYDFEDALYLLTHSNVEVRNTGMSLLHEIDTFDEDMFESISKMICHRNIPPESSVRLINALTGRCSDVVNAKNKKAGSKEAYLLDYIVFLLNTAIDFHNIDNKKLMDYEDNAYSRGLKHVKDDIVFRIFPSLLWEDHKGIFEVCYKGLQQLPAGCVNFMKIKVIFSILSSRHSMPMHCFIAILRLYSPLVKNTDYQVIMNEWTLSCLITISILTGIDFDERWYQMNVNEPLDAMNLSKNLAFVILQIINKKGYGQPSPAIVFNVLRVMNFFATRHYFEPMPEISGLLRDSIRKLVEEECLDKAMKLQPLYRHLYSYFSPEYWH